MNQPMQVDEESASNADFINVSQYLVETLQGVLENFSATSFEYIFDMIKTNLTFDDPGLFLQNTIKEAADFRMQEAITSWLINQIVFVSSSNGQFKKLNKSIFELQNEMLSASYVKQPWLFSLFANEYVKLTKILIHSHCVTADIPLTFKIFQLDNFDLSIFHPNCSWKTVEVKSQDTLNNMIGINLKLLTEIMTTTQNPETQQNCTNVVLQAMDSATFRNKIISIKFFIKLMNLGRTVEDNCNKIIKFLFQAIKAIDSRLALWIKAKIVSSDDLLNYKNVLSNFLECPAVLVSCCRNKDNFTLASAICTQTIRNSVEYFEDFDKLHMTIYRFLAQLFESDFVEANEYLQEVKELGRFEYCLLESFALKEFKSGSLSMHNTSWSKINEILSRNINSVNTEVNQDTLEENLRQIKMIFELTNRIEFRFKIWKQNELRKEICKSDNQPKLADLIIPTVRVQFFDNIQTLMDRFFQMLDKSDVAITTTALQVIIEISFYTLNMEDCRNLDNNTQSKLLLLSTFVCLTSASDFYQEFRQIFPKLSNKFASLLPDELKTLQSFAMQLLPKVNGSMSESNTRKYLSILDDTEMTNEITIQYLLHRKFDKISIILSKQLEVQAANARHLNMLICYLSGDAFVIQKETNLEFDIFCKSCNEAEILATENINKLFLFQQTAVDKIINFNDIDDRLLVTLIKFEDDPTRIDLIKCLSAFANHLPHVLCRPIAWNTWTRLINDRFFEISVYLAESIGAIMESVQASTIADTVKQDLNKAIQEQLLVSVRKALETDDRKMQQCSLNLIVNYTTSQNQCEKSLLTGVRLLVFFIMSVESQVTTAEVTFAALKICSSQNVKPKIFVNWHKESIFKLAIRLAVGVYLKYGYGLQKILFNFSNMLGYADFKREFMPKFYSTILAMLVPLMTKYPEVTNLIDDCCTLVNCDLENGLSKSFFPIYVYVHLNESSETVAKCMTYLIQSTGKSIESHLKVNIKKTLPEILLCYNKNCDFVINTFRILLSKNNQQNGAAAGNSSEKDCSIAEISDFISTRFLGVLTHFGQIIIFNDIEKCLQEETLKSLGEILRFMGTKHITPHRFKILAVLRSAMTIEHNDVRDICARIWKIFIHTVEMASLGPLLSIIIVSLEPLMQSHAKDVNDILTYLIIDNGNLLSVHISDLFFLEDTNASVEIKKFVRLHLLSIKDSDSFMNRFRLYFKHINHENLDVRIYGLKYLTRLFAQNRHALNELIIGQQDMNPIIDELLNILMIGTKNDDENFQLNSGICLAEVGAIDPSLLATNYAPQQNFALSILTDAFSIMALAELCRAYQFQKDTKYVDGFSLAIQEILLTRGVCPVKRKKMDVWNAIPERMRPLMETLLSSCYTAIPSNVKSTTHPIFGSSKCKSSESWAYSWASNMIESILDADTKHLLKSFKSSCKNDSNILAMFLPYIIVHAIQSHCPEDIEKIEEEFKYVFTAVINQSNKDNDPHQQNVAIKCAKLAFNQIDFLERWIREWKKTYATNRDAQCMAVENFLQNFDKKIMADANFKCGEYARALMQIEAYIEENVGERLQAELSFLSAIYAELMDSDSLEGALCLKRIKPTLSEQILVNNITGRLQDSAVCFEKIIQIGDVVEQNVVDMVQCYLGLQQPETALLVSQSLMEKFYNKNNETLLKECSEPLWRLGRFEELDELLENKTLRSSKHWGVRCGQVLLDFRQATGVKFESEIKNCFFSVLKQLQSSDDQSAYQKAYPLVMKLHLISEMKNAQTVVDEFSNHNEPQLTMQHANDVLTELFNKWDSRLELLHPTTRNIEPVLCLRRIFLDEITAKIKQNVHNDQIRCQSMAQISTYIGKSLIKSIELARNEEMYPQAQLFILNAESYAPPELFIEKAKLFWKKGDRVNSLKVLEQGVGEIETMLGASSPNLKKIYAEAKFLIATYYAESMNTNTYANIQYFMSAIKALPESEKSLVYYAQYLDRVFEAKTSVEQQQTKGYELLNEIMACYGKSMMYGCNYIHQSMPRFLSIWFDFTAKPKLDDNHKKITANMNKMAQRFSEILPSFVFFTAFSQLVSRICHPSTDVYSVLKTIICKLILDFPQQSLWMILSVYKSSYANRMKRCAEIFSDPRLASPKLQKLIRDFNSMAERFIELTNKDLVSSQQSSYSINSVYRQLPKLLTDRDFSDILVPYERFMKPVLPSVGERDKSAASFNAFPNDFVYIRNVQDEMIVLLSLQRPKRVTLMGSDGKEYTIMMKPKDDLRKDFRLMEFNGIVRQYLHQNAEARQRRLYIRTYAVLPLNEECGILEWVPNLQSYRSIIFYYYKQRKLALANKELREYQGIAKDPTEKRRKIFVERLLPKHPVVFADWFKERFTTPHNWYQARSSYIRTTAVISIVGYILGLGDRHGENILFDNGNGDTVHVDFNCLFNKGEQFDVPEVVPFRLTHNMVHAMGPLGIEGLFRKCCQITMAVLQKQMPTLMSVLRPFVYDPLVSWNRTIKPNDGKTERTDSQAMTNVKHIEDRLMGLIKINGIISNMPLSTEGVVNHCISQAMDIDNLSAMYIGWGPFY